MHAPNRHLGSVLRHRSKMAQPYSLTGDDGLVHDSLPPEGRKISYASSTVPDDVTVFSEENPPDGVILKSVIVICILQYPALLCISCHISLTSFLIKLLEAAKHAFCSL